MSDHQRSGLGLAVAGFICLSLGDAVVKSMVGQWPAIAEAALRFSIGAAVLSLMMLHSEGPCAFIPTLSMVVDGPRYLACGGFGQFFSAIYLMQLAEVMAIAFRSPVLTQLLAGVLLKEVIHRRVWYASLAAFDFGWPGRDVVLRCAVVAFTASTAHWLAYVGAARAGAAAMAPAIYVQMLVAIGLGWWRFDDRPDLATLVGAALIVGSGLYLWQAGKSPQTT